MVTQSNRNTNGNTGRDNRDNARNVTVKGHSKEEVTEKAKSKPDAISSGDAVGKTGSNVATLTSRGRSQTKRVGIFANMNATAQNAANAKVTLISTAKQRIAHAFDLFKQGGDAAREAQEIANDASVPLVEAVAKGDVAPDEVSSILGDVFGYKVKGKPQDGAPPTTAGVPKTFNANGLTASKTPFGEGETIRKRIMRAVQADQYVNGGEATAFFAGLDEKDVRDILNQVKSGNMSLFTAYDRFAKLKPRAERVDNAFNPKMVSAMFESLAADGGIPAAQLIRRSPSLIAAYAALIEAIGIVEELAAELNESEPLTDVAPHEGDADEGAEIEAANVEHELNEQAA